MSDSKSGNDPVYLRADLAWCATMLVALASVFAGLTLMPNVAWPVLIAGIAACLVDPLVVKLQGRGLSRTAATAVLFAAAFLVGGLVLYLLFPILLTQVQKLPGYFLETVDGALPMLRSRFHLPIPDDIDNVQSLLSDRLDTIAAQVLPQAGGVLSTVIGGGIMIGSAIFGAVVIAVVGFSLVVAWPNLRTRAHDLVPPAIRAPFLSRMDEVDRMIGGFIRGQLIVVVFLATTYSIILSALGLKLAVLAAVFTGVANLVPYLGTVVGLVLASVLCLVDFGLDHRLILVVLTYIAVSNTDALFVTPRVVGNRVGLPPAAVIVSLLAMGTLLGVAGVFLAVPTAASLRLIARVLLGVYRRSRVYTGT